MCPTYYEINFNIHCYYYFIIIRIIIIKIKPIHVIADTCIINSWIFYVVSYSTFDVITHIQRLGEDKNRLRSQLIQEMFPVYSHCL